LFFDSLMLEDDFQLFDAGGRLSTNLSIIRKSA